MKDEDLEEKMWKESMIRECEWQNHIIRLANTARKEGLLALEEGSADIDDAFLKKGETIEDCEGRSKVWTKEGNVFKAHKVETGTTNGVMTEILSGIAPGTEVLTDFNISGGEMGMPEQQATNPFMPRPGNRNRAGQGQGQNSNGGGQAPRRQ